MPADPAASCTAQPIGRLNVCAVGTHSIKSKAHRLLRVPLEVMRWPTPIDPAIKAISCDPVLSTMAHWLLSNPVRSRCLTKRKSNWLALPGTSVELNSGAALLFNAVCPADSAPRTKSSVEIISLGMCNKYHLPKGEAADHSKTLMPRSLTGIGVPDSVYDIMMDVDPTRSW